MSQDGMFLIRGASPRVVLSILENKQGLDWYTDMPLEPEDTTSKPGVIFAVPDYFPSDAKELERYRQRLLQLVPPDELKQLMGDPRGMFVFDPMMVQAKDARNHDEIVEACSEDLGTFGLWFDPLRPTSEQTITFAERETIVLTPDMLEEIVGSPKKTKRAAAKKPAAKKPATKKPATKKPVAKTRAAKKTSKKKPAPKKASHPKPSRGAAKRTAAGAKKRRR